MAVRSVVPLDDGTCAEEVEIRGDVPEDLVRRLRELDSTDRVEVLDDGTNRLHLRIVGRGCGLADTIRRTGVAPSFPFPVGPERDRWDVTGSPTRTRAFLEAIEETPLEVETVYAGPNRTGRADLLTDRQREILEAAVEAGFYAYPRQTTLTELADELGIVKSTLSQSLMVIEKKVFQELAARGEVELR